MKLADKSSEILKTITTKWTCIVFALVISTSAFCQFKPTFKLSDSLELKKNTVFL